MASITKLEGEARVRRLVESGRSGELVATMTAQGLMIREKRRRTAYGPIPWGWLLIRGATMEADRRRAEKKAARKARALSRRGGR